jgi:hypothetical protein
VNASLLPRTQSNPSWIIAALTIAFRSFKQNYYFELNYNNEYKSFHETQNIGAAMDQTINDVFARQSKRYGNRLAIEKKTNGQWHQATWTQYYERARETGLG